MPLKYVFGLAILVSFFRLSSARAEVDLRQYENRVLELEDLDFQKNQREHKKRWRVFKIENGRFVLQASSGEVFGNYAFNLDGSENELSTPVFELFKQGYLHSYGLGSEDYNGHELFKSYLEQKAQAYAKNFQEMTGINTECGYTDISRLVFTPADVFLAGKLVGKDATCASEKEYIHSPDRIKLAPEFAQLKIYFNQSRHVSTRRTSVANMAGGKLNLSVMQVTGEREPRFTDQIHLTFDVLYPSATGFYISQDGLFLTNHHIIDKFFKCQSKLSCELDFRQVINPETAIHFKAQVDKYIDDVEYDVALLKIHLPKGVEIQPLQIATDHIGPRLMAAGFIAGVPFAGAKVSSWPTEDTDLTYTFGDLVGFNKYAYSTSLHLGAGASGSPIVNMDDLRVVAIHANSNESLPKIFKNISNLSIPRPIHPIDYHFGLRDYISGKKQQRVDMLILQMGLSDNPQEVKKLLTQLDKEKTLYGLSAIGHLIPRHHNREIAIMLSEYIKSKNVVAN